MPDRDEHTWMRIGDLRKTALDRPAHAECRRAGGVHATAIGVSSGPRRSVHVQLQLGSPGEWG